ncbi:5-carboxymethyl-2-hydroxymuconate isomerase [Pseudovibrio japonicus]|uniref:5-carboxymethyl-2-hydroxymuconate isomerase n=1 Tax=Pseudovibrio japonicus TaxID=366534 RepID=A0ABQ3EC91_9HYPH|nr:5-carboxymethyl-2-hydroxymuconate Delta-isomerase [Pseudovibrio japonicus]GHB27816.1 5-carboxymethyl-2-hydroxymuconate isomerase [Pseudovibrio japonicus]
MPHAIIECSKDVLKLHSSQTLCEEVHKVTFASNLFGERDIKVRLLPFEDYLAGGKREDFIHITAYILAGRTTDQKAKLSSSILERMSDLFPQVEFITVDVRDIDREIYAKR